MEDTPTPHVNETKKRRKYIKIYTLYMHEFARISWRFGTIYKEKLDYPAKTTKWTLLGQDQLRKCSSMQHQSWIQYMHEAYQFISVRTHLHLDFSL